MKRFFNTPSHMQAFPDSRSGYAKLLYPSIQRLSSPLKGNEPVISLVSLLGFVGSPSNVPYLIITIAINAIKRHSFRALSKMAIEAFESSQLQIDCYSASTVKGVSDIARILDSCDHASPRFIGSCLLFTLGLPMRLSVPRKNLFSEAPAGLTVAVTQGLTGDFFHCPALAAANPFRCFVGTSNTGNHRPAPNDGIFKEDFTFHGSHYGALYAA